MAKQPAHPSGRVVSVRLAPDIEGRLNDLAERTGRSRGFYLRLALEAMLPELERRTTGTKPPRSTRTTSSWIASGR